MDNSPYFRISFINESKVYDMYAKSVYQSDLYGFIVVEEFVFNKNTSVVVDPSEEKLKDEFSNVARSYIPLHSIIRIDEVESKGVAKIHDLDGKVRPFPGNLYTPTQNNSE